MKIGLVDYGLGNIFSVRAALQSTGHTVRVFSDDQLPGDVELLLLPGVAAFQAGMRNIFARGQHKIIEKWVVNERPLIGLCLGAQLLLEASEEAPGVSGFGFIEGNVRSLGRGANSLTHQGWAVTTFSSPNLAESVKPTYLYYSHSFELNPKRPEVANSHTTIGEREIVSGVGTDKVIGFQFHPERSGVQGVEVLNAALKEAVGNG